MKRLLLILALLVARPVGADEADPGIFADDSVFEIDMHFPFAGLCMNPRDDECEDVPGWISYPDSGGDEVRVDIRIRTRGRWNPKTANCEFPSLFIFFDADQAEGTVFEAQTMLPLTTHCKHHYRNYEDYVQIEYLTHQIYGLLTEISLRTRLMQVHYKDTESRLNRKRYAFFVEHFEQMAARTGTRYIEVDDLDLDKVRPEEMARFSVFQLLIGNLDWSAFDAPGDEDCCHNSKLIGKDDETIPKHGIPYDFDSSGLVDAHYAVPPDGLGMRHIRQRLYRGFCFANDQLPQAVALFNEKKPDILALFQNNRHLNDKTRNIAINYIEDFYQVINDPKQFEKQIIDRCRG